MTVPAEAAGMLDEVDLRQADLPPIALLATVALGLVVVGGIYMAATIGHPATLVPAVVLAASAGALMIVNAILLARIGPFAWRTFFVVGGWALLAYVVQAGLLEFVFVDDHTPARALALFSVMLAMFALDVPLLLAYAVARYQPAPDMVRSTDPPVASRTADRG